MTMQQRENQFTKRVIDGVYETNKMLLRIGDSEVVKMFKPKKSSPRRYGREKESLQRMHDIEGVPTLIATNDEQHTIRMSRLPGQTAKTLSVENAVMLSKIVYQMLAAGVARHSLPIRDIVVDSKGNLGLVDFERVTLCRHAWSPIWRIARKVSIYHLYRLINEHQPQLLSPKAKMVVQLGGMIRRIGLVIRAFK
ncbi:RIO2 family protein [Vibrio porteresiae]|uniref:Uncharacterized protein n=1 Tax=Vibrio porteresiae DSM 19223 TaxID=1123496 RepID=A0ABZ0QLT4_9VIBR|nr:hypothetical protein [Vibrio porteresiae]WPC76366.1 hypothetical protein R8Z52_17710 [Vibrio porteresiae DSM 19223]